MYAPPPPKKDLFESLKENQIGLVLIGIVIGILIISMRPIIIQPVK